MINYVQFNATKFYRIRKINPMALAYSNLPIHPAINGMIYGLQIFPKVLICPQVMLNQLLTLLNFTILFSTPPPPLSAENIFYPGRMCWWKIACIRREHEDKPSLDSGTSLGAEHRGTRLGSSRPHRLRVPQLSDGGTRGEFTVVAVPVSSQP